MSATSSAPTAAPDLGAVVNEAVTNEGRSASWTSERASAVLRMYGRPSGSNPGALQRFVSRSRNGVRVQITRDLLIGYCLIAHIEPAAKEAAGMTKRQKKAKVRSRRTILRIPDLEQSKHAVLNSLPAKSSQESYGHAINEFISWYCSEPRLAFNRTVVLRYRFFLEQKSLAPSTINVRLAAIRRLAYEAADTGLLRTRCRHCQSQRSKTVGGADWELAHC